MYPRVLMSTNLDSSVWCAGHIYRLLNRLTLMFLIAPEVAARVHLKSERRTIRQCQSRTQSTNLQQPSAQAFHTFPIRAALRGGSEYIGLPCPLRNHGIVQSLWNKGAKRGKRDTPKKHRPKASPGFYGRVPDSVQSLQKGSTRNASCA